MLSKAHKQLDLLCAEQNVGKTGLSAITKDVAAPTKTVALAGPLVDFILESLSFKSMKNREEEVADAHANTFDWVFKYDSGDGGRNSLGDQFTSWLQNDKLGSIYWG